MILTPIRTEPTQTVSSPVDPAGVRVLILTDACPEDAREHFTASDPDTPAWQNTQQLFAAAGLQVGCYQDLLEHGIAMETCLDGLRPRRLSPFHLSSGAARIEAMLGRFPNLKALMLMGEVAIRCFHHLTRPRWSSRRQRSSEHEYQIRGVESFLGPVQVFPSYLHTAAGFLQERARCRTVIEQLETVMQQVL